MNEIARLKQRVKDIQDEQARERELHKPKPNERMAEDTPDFIESYDFWCDVCELDFTAPAYKTVHRLYGDPVVCYRTRHECGEECVRLISHRDHDPYYQKSEKIRRQRNEYVADVLQAEQYGFKTRYGDPYEKFNKDLEKREKEIIQSEKDKGFKGLSLQAQQELNRLRNG